MEDEGRKGNGMELMKLIALVSSLVVGYGRQQAANAPQQKRERNQESNQWINEMKATNKRNELFFADSNTILELFAAEEEEEKWMVHQAAPAARQAQPTANQSFFVKIDWLLVGAVVFVFSSLFFNQINGCRLFFFFL